MIKQKTCAFYCRVSTEEQNADRQISQLKTMQKLQNYMLFKIYIDKMSGGSANRPDFQQMLKDARLRKFEILCVTSLDRFSREGIVNTLTYLKRLKKYGVALKSVRESWCDTTDEGLGEILISIVAWLSKHERERISDNTKKKLEQYKKDIEEKGFFINKKGEKCYSLGRPKGSKDKDPKGRNNLGYLKRWEK